MMLVSVGGGQARLVDVVALGGTPSTPAVVTFRSVQVVDKIIVTFACPTQGGASGIVYNALFDSITAVPVAAGVFTHPYTTAVTPVTAFYTAQAAGQSFTLPVGWSVCTGTINGMQADYSVSGGMATFALPVSVGDSVAFLCIE